MKVFTVTKTKVTAGDGSFPIETSLWGVFYMGTQENLLCVSWLNNYNGSIHEGGFSIGTRQIFPRGPFIEIYGESHNDYNYASKNYKMLHDRPI